MVGVVTGLSAGAIAAIGVGVSAVGIGVGAYEANKSQGIAQEGENLAATTAGEQQYYNSLLQALIADPASVSKLPGFQFELNTGSAAVAAGEGAGGFAGSGNEGAALTEFGQGLASQFYNQQTSLLASLSGVTAPSSPASAISAATGAQNSATSTLSGLLNSLGFYSRLAGGQPSGAPAGTPASTAPPTTQPGQLFPASPLTGDA
jgi:hypothetical protein